ncbi:MAG: hypothetical protein WDW36_008744 [Sanguina aurantia]
MRSRQRTAITSLVATFLLRSAAGYSAATCPGNGSSLAFVTWGASLGCSPPVCGACQLTDIAGAAGALPVSLAARMPMFDTDAVRARMAGLRATFLGDSTMVETVHDLAILLSGIGGDDPLLTSYKRQATRVSKDTRVCIPFRSEPAPRDLSFTPAANDGGTCADGTEVLFFQNHRSMRIRIPQLDFCLRFRFTGHHLQNQDNGGTATFFQPSFQAKLRRLIDSPCDDQRSDLLVVNSGRHDFIKPDTVGSPERYQSNLQRLSTLLEQVQANGTTVLWRGNSGPWTLSGPQWRESIPRSLMASSNIPYIDVREVMEHVLLYYPLDCFASDVSHIGAIAYYHNESKSMLVSSMTTQKIIGGIFGALSR